MNHRSKKRARVANRAAAKGQPEKFDGRQAIKDFRGLVQAMEQIKTAAIRLARTLQRASQAGQAMRQRQEARHIH